MHRSISLLLTLFLGTSGFCYTDTLEINGHRYTLQTMEDENENELGAKQAYILVKNFSEKGNSKYDLKHTTYEGWGDCNSESIQLGSYEVTDTSLILYSFWCHMGDAPVSPWGARKQVYAPNENGQLEMIYSELFVEVSENGWEGYEGVIYLYESATTEEQKEQYRKYIYKVEKEYNANFVYGKQADDLLKEVKAYLAGPIQEQTSHWDLSNGFGIKR